MAKNLFAAFVLGAGLALVVAVMREVLYDRIRSADDVERKLGMPILGLTPLVEEGEVNQENRRIGEAYSTIRTSIEFALPRSDRNILVFTSSQSSEGKTTSAVFFAMKSAQLGRKVLLVDADLRKPSVAGQFGVNRNNKGFVEVLLGECTFAEALLRQPQENLDVLPVGPIPSNPVDVLSSPLVRQFVERHAPNYAFIIFDSPPVMGLADTPLLTRYADGVVFFVESNKAHVGQTRQALRRLRDAGANVLGVVLTKFKALDAGLSYDYEYHYYSYGEGGKK